MKRFEIIDIVWIFLSFLIPKFLFASECVFDVDLTLSTKTQDIFHSCNSMVRISDIFNLYIPILDILFSSNHNIHKNSFSLCFWAPDLLFDRILVKSIN